MGGQQQAMDNSPESRRASLQKDPIEDFDGTEIDPDELQAYMETAQDMSDEADRNGAAKSAEYAAKLDELTRAFYTYLKNEGVDLSDQNAVSEYFSALQQEDPDQYMKLSKLFAFIEQGDSLAEENGWNKAAQAEPMDEAAQATPETAPEEEAQMPQ
jgi:glucan phosphorylase